MYISAGKEWMDSREIIGIFDLDITSQSHLTREYLKAAEQRGHVINAAEDLPKTFTVCVTRTLAHSTVDPAAALPSAPVNEKVYLSQASSATLRLRTEKNTMG